MHIQLSKMFPHSFLENQTWIQISGEAHSPRNSSPHAALDNVLVPHFLTQGWEFLCSQRESRASSPNRFYISNSHIFPSSVRKPYHCNSQIL